MFNPIQMIKLGKRILMKGVTRSSNLIQITKELWDYYLQKEITITAEHLPGHMNQQANQQSR